MMAMSKFGSLMFREFRLIRKNTILYTVLLLAWAALTWCVLFSLDANGIDPNGLSADNLVIATALLGAIVLFVDDLHHTDIVSGWTTYSYALPVTPFERTAVRFVRRFLTCAGSCLICLIHSAATCAYLGKPFGVNYIVWHMLAFSAVILYSLPDAFFSLRTRTGEEAKKMRNVSGMASLTVIVVSVLAIVMVSGIDLPEMMTGNASVKLPVFTAGAFLWALPLLFGLMAADFGITYHSLRTAYPGAPKTQPARREKTAYAVNDTGITTGFLHKDLAQNSTVFMLVALVPLLLTALPLCFTAMDVMTGTQSAAYMFETAANELIRMIMIVMGIFIVSGMMSEVFQDDDRKAWAYFIASTPQGVRGYLYSKYIVMLMMNLIYMSAGIFADTLFSTAYYFATGREITTSMLYLYLAGVFVIMMIHAFDIPLTVLYGLKRGSLLKTTVMLTLCAAAVFGFAMLPEHVQDQAAAFAISVLYGKADDILLLILSICPYLCFGAFVFSYRISCKAFMKGVNEYDK